MKKIVMIIILLIMNIVCFRYLIESINGKIAFHYEYDDRMYLIPKKELILDDTENFIFDDYFLILSLIDNGYRYEFDEKYLFIYLKDSLYKLEYSIEDKSDIEETIEDTETINDVSKERTDIGSIEDHADTSSSEVQSLSQEYIEQIQTSGREPFVLKTENLSFHKGTDLQNIIQSIYASFESAIPVYIDYSELNPNIPGVYQIILNHESDCNIIKVHIQEE